MKLYSVIYHKLVSLPLVVFSTHAVKSILTQKFVKDNPIVEVIESAETVEVSTLRQECEIALNDLNPESFAEFKYEDGLWINLKTPYNNIQLLSSAIRELTGLVKFQEQIPLEEADKEYVEVTLEQFLLTKDGHYQNIPKAIKDFRSAGLSLCKAMEPSDAASHGVYEYNRRVLTKLFICIKNITKTLEI